jgi:thioredoxin 1
MASDKVLTITETNFGDTVLKSAQPILVDFWAPWCGPCKMIAPILDELAEEYHGRVLVGKLNVDDHQSLAVQFGVSGIPMLLFFKGGQVVDQIRGLRSKKDLKETFDRVSK